MRLKQLIILYLEEYPIQSYIADSKQIFKSSNIIISKIPCGVAFFVGEIGVIRVISIIGVIGIHIILIAPITLIISTSSEKKFVIHGEFY